eukprot:CAMPEP_0169453996 /NCGR_PEP_ID=MMETSP1042-20121227/15048_1 /TAXON_ID=464988 /ORGANISM="Hemiselmis andersenii, Strain CCMP1180" /LENGTH=271 /DNA_ID=CAMNT_0009566051 /DNA_START=218 /DNA_END=1029 /DNA_ORIENTATION=+
MASSSSYLLFLLAAASLCVCSSLLPPISVQPAFCLPQPPTPPAVARGFIRRAGYTCWAGARLGNVGLSSEKRAAVSMSETAGDGCDGARVHSLHRFAVKGLCSDLLSSVDLSPGSAFPSDRRWALLRDSSPSVFDPSAPKWLHKENFACAFTSLEVLQAVSTRYDDTARTLHVSHPTLGGGEFRLEASGDVEKLSDWCSRVAGEGVKLVGSAAGEHKHQFGNTKSGVRRNGDTRTVSIVNAETIKQVSEATGVQLDPMRFRANVVVDGLAP